MQNEKSFKKAYDDVISVFYDIAQDMTSSFDRKEIINLATTLLSKVVNYESICFLKYSPKKDIYLVEKTINISIEKRKYLHKLIKEGVILWAGNIGKPFLELDEENKNATVIVPILSKEIMKGAIIINTNKSSDYFDQNRLKILTILSSQVSISFENLSLYENLEKRNDKLRYLKNYMDNVVKSIINGIIVLDTDLKIRVFNKKSEELLNIKTKKVASKRIDEIDINKEFSDYIKGFISRTKSGETVLDEEFEYKIGDKIIPIGVSSTQLKELGKDLGTIFVLRDLSESRELRELKRIDKLKDEFLSMVSHELRTPLTSIKAYAETLMYMVEDEEPDPESQTEFLNIINEEAERLSRLINDVLDLSKIEAGKMTFILKEENINEIIERSIKNIKGFTDNKNIETILKLEENLPNVIIDKDRTLQVMANLLSNATKFTPENGKIYVYTKMMENDFIEVKVKDTGIGIKEDEVEKVFEKFKQSDDILTREAGGTGLGLPICRNIIEYYGGKIWAESEYGNGSEFMFTLPPAGAKRNEE